jgi:hypothetical protein
MHKILSAALLLLTFASPLRADLHYTLHTEAKPIATTEPANPFFGDLLVRMILPEGATDSTYWVSDKGIRVELTKANVIIPAGSVLLHLSGGTTVVMNPQEHSYWKLTLPEMPPQVFTAMSQLNPQAALVHTGEFDTIAGVRAEHITNTITMELPAPPSGVPLPPDMPTSVTLRTDSWTSDQYAHYAALAKSTVGLMALGALIPDGFTLKTVMRNSMMPSYEIESVVTSLSEEAAPADAFDIPADYKEVPAPTRLGMGAPR